MQKPFYKFFVFKFVCFPVVILIDKQIFQTKFSSRQNFVFCMNTAIVFWDRSIKDASTVAHKCHVFEIYYVLLSSMTCFYEIWCVVYKWSLFVWNIDECKVKIFCVLLNMPLWCKFCLYVLCNQLCFKNQVIDFQNGTTCLKRSIVFQI